MFTGKNSNNFKVGDRLICINPNDYDSRIKKGDLVTVDCIRSMGTIKVRLSSGKVVGGFFQNRFKRATVKNTAIARAYYKNRIEKIENNLIYLKE